MSEPNRLIVIDDKDGRVMYSEGWQSVGGDDYNSQGNTGTTYQNSLHGTATDGAYMSFSFKGNHARIIGTHDFQVDSAGALSPDWECTLDGEAVQKADISSVVRNRWTLCAFPNLPDRDHTIGLTVKTRGRNFWLDYVEYKSTGAVDGEIIWASRDDADIWYSEQWLALGNIARYTLNKGSSATFKFNGTGVSLYAMYPAELPHASGKATYSMDDGPSTPFTIPGGGDTTMYNRQMFEVNNLSKQVHTITITGTNLRAPATGGTSTTPATGTSSATATTGEGSSSPTIGAAVGGVLGTIAVSLLIWYRYRRRRIDLHGDNAVDQPSSRSRGAGAVVTPTTILSSHPDNPPPAQGPIHPAARTKRRPAFVQANNTPFATVSPSPESGYASPNFPPAPSRPVYHEDSGVRLPALAETDAVVEHPPMYTIL